MQSWIFKLGAVVAMAQSIAGTGVHIKNTSPRANVYVHHCSLVLDGELLGCSGSSSPFDDQCGRNSGTQTKKICDDLSVSVNWYTGEVKFDGSNGNAKCTLSTTQDGGHCNTDDPDQFPKGDYNAASSLMTRGNAVYGLAVPMVAAGMLL